MQRRQGLGRGKIAHPQAHPGVLRLKALQHRQQQAAQRALACGQGHAAVLQIPALGYERFSRLNFRKGDADVAVKLLPLLRQQHAPVRSEKQGTAQLRLHIFQGAGQVRLAVMQLLCRFGQAAAGSHMVKNPVILVIDIHVSFPFAISY